MAENTLTGRYVFGLLELLARVSNFTGLFIISPVAYGLIASGLVAQFFGVHTLFLDDEAAHLTDDAWRNSPAFNGHMCLALAIQFAWMVAVLMGHASPVTDLRKALLFYLKRDLPIVAVLATLAFVAVVTSQISFLDLDMLAANQYQRGLIGTIVALLASTVLVVGALVASYLLKQRAVWFFLGAFYVIIGAALTHPLLIPATSIFLLLTLLQLVYLVFKLLPRLIRLPAFALLICALIAAYQTAGSFTVPGLEGTTPVTVGSSVPPTNVFDSVPPVKSLEAWKASLNGRPAKLVIVATSGGAYRAAFWTSIILDELVYQSRSDGPHAGLAKNIRLLTGASGGMVASAYFAIYNDAEWAQSKHSITTLMEDEVLTSQASDKATYTTSTPVPRDSLSAVSQQLIQRDILRLVGMGSPANDRGRVLEESWATLRRHPFGSLAGHEAAGLRPSLILSPTIAETGKPMLISNLDLSEMVEAGHKPTVFFDIFPDARKKLSVATAVRLNATFPYVSPIVPLPTKPVWHLVDAGFYDNYGVGTALDYLMMPSVKTWLKRNVTGVLIIQVRAFQQDAPTFREHGSWTKCEIIKPEAEKRPSAFFWLTAPVEAVATVRDASMRLRGDREIALIKSAYEHGFIETVAIENTARASMSWYVPTTEKACMESEKVSNFNNNAYRQIANWWHSR